MKHYKYVFNLELYEPKWWERVLLNCVPLKTQFSPTLIFWYKEFWNRLYVYSHAHVIHEDAPDQQTIDSYPWDN